MEGGDGVVGSPRDDRELQVSAWVWAPLFTRSAALSPLPFPPLEEEMVKDYIVAAGTSKGGSAAKGKDNVLAASGCHILITSLKKRRGGGAGRKNRTEQQNRKRLHHADRARDEE